MVFPPEDVLFSQAFNFHFQICGNNGQAVELLAEVLDVLLHALPASLLSLVPVRGESTQPPCLSRHFQPLRPEGSKRNRLA